MKIIIFLVLLALVLPAKNKIDEKEFEIYLLRASNSLSFSNYESSLFFLKKALLSAPENEDVKLYLSIFLSAGKEYLKSQILLFKTKKIENSELVNFYKYYNYYFMKKDLEKEGIKKYKNIRVFLLKNKDKLSKEKLLFLSVTSFLDNDKKSSFLFFEEAVKKDKNLLSLGYKLNFSKEIVYDIYKKLSPPYDFYYYNSLAKLEINFNDNKKAIKSLNKALENDKNNFLSKKLLAEAYLNLKDYDKSLKYFLEVKTFYNGKEDLYLNLSRIYKHKENYKKLLSTCKEGLQIIPYSKDLRYCVAEGLHKNKRFKESLFNLEYLIEQFPNSPEINFLIGIVLEDFGKEISKEDDEYKRIAMGVNYLKNFKKPIEYYIRAFELKPISPEVIKKILGEITVLFIDKNEKLDENLKDEIKMKNNNHFLEYYEPFVENENIEHNNMEFYKYFIKYLNSKSESAMKEMKYLTTGSTMILYCEFLKDNNEKNFNKFMDKYARNYLKTLSLKYGFNQILYSFEFKKSNKSIEQLKVYDFILPSYFE